MIELASHADDDGSHVYPSRKLVASRTQMSRTVVQRIQRHAEALGYIERVAAQRQHRPTEWRICVELLTPNPAQTARHTATPDSDGAVYRAPWDDSEASRVVGEEPRVVGNASRVVGTSPGPATSRPDSSLDSSLDSRGETSNNEPEPLHDISRVLIGRWAEATRERLVDGDFIHAIDALRCADGINDADVRHALASALLRIDQGSPPATLLAFVRRAARAHAKEAS
jgi:hypothetical protein